MKLCCKILLCPQKKNKDKKMLLVLVGVIKVNKEELDNNTYYY